MYKFNIEYYYNDDEEPEARICCYASDEGESIHVFEEYGAGGYGNTCFAYGATWDDVESVVASVIQDAKEFITERRRNKQLKRADPPSHRIIEV